jgi:hypothetical protein
MSCLVECLLHIWYISKTKISSEKMLHKTVSYDFHQKKKKKQSPMIIVSTCLTDNGCVVLHAHAAEGRVWSKFLRKH